CGGASEVPHSVAEQRTADGVRLAILRVRADWSGGLDDQHRDDVRVRDRVRRGDCLAEAASQCGTAFPPALGAGGTRVGNADEPGADVWPWRFQLGAADRVAGDRPGGLFRAAAGAKYSGRVRIDRSYILETLARLVQINSINPTLAAGAPGEK